MKMMMMFFHPGGWKSRENMRECRSRWTTSTSSIEGQIPDISYDMKYKTYRHKYTNLIHMNISKMNYKWTCELIIEYIWEINQEKGRGHWSLWEGCHSGSHVQVSNLYWYHHFLCIICIFSVSNVFRYGCTSELSVLISSFSLYHLYFLCIICIQVRIYKWVICICICIFICICLCICIIYKYVSNLYYCLHYNICSGARHCLTSTLVTPRCIVNFALLFEIFPQWGLNQFCLKNVSSMQC